MDKQILDGIKFGFGMIFSMTLLFTIVYAVGFHIADEIVSGTFLGNYTYSGNVNFTNANIIGLASIPSGFVGAFNLTSCPYGWSNFKCDKIFRNCFVFFINIFFKFWGCLAEHLLA